MNIDARFLVIDDDEVFCSVLQRSLSRTGYQVKTASDSNLAIVSLKEFQPDHIVLDLRLGNESGIDLISPILEINPAARILVLTGYASLATAVQAIKLGAIDYLPKPVDEQAVLHAFGLIEKEHEEPEIPDTPVSLKRLEWEQIQRVLKENDGNITNTAKQLGMYRRTLQRKLQKKPGKW